MPNPPSFPTRAHALCANAVRWGNYVECRTLAGYRSKLGPSFTQRLARLGPDERWLDSGAGEAYAQREYLESCQAHGRDPCALVACDCYPPERPNPYRKPFSCRLRFVVRDADALDQAAVGGPVSLITDLYGALAYSPAVDAVLLAYLKLLHPGGLVCAHLSVAGIRFTSAHGFGDYLAAIGGVRQPVVFKSCPNGAGLDLTLERTTAPIEVPPLELVDTQWHLPPLRTFRWPDHPPPSLAARVAHAGHQLGRATACVATTLMPPMHRKRAKARGSR